MNRRKWISRLIGWAVFAAFIWIVLQNWADEREFIRLISGTQPGWIALAAFLQLFTYAAEAGLWKTVVARAGEKIGWSSLIALALVKLFTDSIIPAGGIAGSVLVVRGLEKRGATRESSMATILVGILGSYGGIALAMLLSALYLHHSGRFEELLLIPMAAYLVVSMIIPGAILFVAGRGGESAGSRIDRLPFVRDVASIARRIPARVVRDPHAIGAAIALEVIILVLDAGTFLALLYSLGAEASFFDVFAALIFAAITGMVSFVPGGLGTFDAVFVGLLVRAGVAVEPALMALLLFRGLAQFAPLIPGSLLAKRELGDTPRA